LNRPTDVAVDPDGDVYVCDWANHRVQIFDPDGKIITSLRGDAQELSKWAKMSLEASPDAMKRRREVHSLEREWRFSFPTAVVFDDHYGRLIVSDTQRNRLQIYNKLKDYQWRRAPSTRRTAHALRRAAGGASSTYHGRGVGGAAPAAVGLRYLAYIPMYISPCLAPPL
jgi:sugar lactone lactonase YvrE